MALLHVTQENYAAEVAESGKLVLLDFWATWCGPCQMIAPILEQVADDLPQITVGKINVDEEPELAGAFGIVSIPTLVIMKEGKPVGQMVGLRSAAEIVSELEMHL